MLHFRFVVSWIAIIAASSTILGQPKVFIAPMDEGFDSFIAAAMLENKVPVTITLDECVASYVITGLSVKGANRWYDTIFGAERDRNQGSIRLVKVSDKTIAWAGAAGDRSFWFGGLKGTGQKKVASRLARELKKDYFNRILPDEAPNAPCSPTEGSKPSPAAPTSVLTTLRINSNPEGAEVLLNGKTVGMTPISLDLKSGEWTISLRKPGFRAWEKFVRVASGENLTVDAMLNR
jgi:hypothetical protein